MTKMIVTAVESLKELLLLLLPAEDETAASCALNALSVASLPKAETRKEDAWCNGS